MNSGLNSGAVSERIDDASRGADRRELVGAKLGRGVLFRGGLPLSAASANLAALRGDAIPRSAIGVSAFINAGLERGAFARGGLPLSAASANLAALRGDAIPRSAIESTTPPKRATRISSELDAASEGGGAQSTEKQPLNASRVSPFDAAEIAENFREEPVVAFDIEEINPVPHDAERLLYWLLPKEMRESLIGDLVEECTTEIAPKFGAACARRWFWKQTCTSIGNAYVPRSARWAGLAELLRRFLS